jgi:nucleoside-diphosphate-sugar epimerase
MSEHWAGARVVVGGGAGFSRSYLVPALVSRGANVTVVDNFENGPSSLPESVAASVTVVEGDLGDSTDVRARAARLRISSSTWPRKASGVGFQPDTSRRDADRQPALRRGPPPHRCGAAGPAHGRDQFLLRLPGRCASATPELDPFLRSPEAVNEGYGWAKRAQELAAAYLSRESGLRVTVLRPFNLYGANYPWRSAEKAHVVPSLVKRVLDGEDPLVVWGSGEQRRNLLHGSDAAEVILRVIESEAAEAVNIGYEDATSVAELVTLICDVTGRHPAIVFDRHGPMAPPARRPMRRDFAP